MPSDVGNYRKFGGQTYKLRAFAPTKRQLQKLQKKFGGGQLYGRIVELPKGSPFYRDGKKINKYGLYVLA